MGMKVNKDLMTWALRIYPPLFFQRIWVRRILPGYRGIDVKVHYSILNRNSNGSIFGGTIFSATDPLYALLLDHIMRSRGMDVIVWLKSAKIRYIIPARSALFISIRIKEETIQEAMDSLHSSGKYVETFTIELVDRSGEVCAVAENEVYIKKKLPQ